jgi:hypothetical protein
VHKQFSGKITKHPNPIHQKRRRKRKTHKKWWRNPIRGISSSFTRPSRSHYQLTATRRCMQKQRPPSPADSWAASVAFMAGSDNHFTYTPRGGSSAGLPKTRRPDPTAVWVHFAFVSRKPRSEPSLAVRLCRTRRAGV